MKKILCLILCVLFSFSMIACSEEKAETKKHSIDIEYYANLGQIPDFDYKLGEDIEDVKERLNATLDDHGESNYFDYESGEYTVMTDGIAYCCYKTDNADAGLTHIVNSGSSYGFEVGAVSSEIKKAMSSLGFDATERSPKDGEIFFIPTDLTTTVLSYEFKDGKVLFVFQEHYLAATVVYK